MIRQVHGTNSIRWAGLALSAALMCAPAARAADDLHATLERATTEGAGPSIGSVTITSSAGGAVFKVDLKGLPPGPHGIHVHENGSCGPTMMNGVRIPAGAAGGHFDPAHAGKHEGPMGHGHLGDLPLLNVAADGTSTQTLTAPSIKDIAQLKGHALVIHAGGDNYSDEPAPLGGGGARLACGTIG
jgi:Cu-Zn family superoxide dismutase